MGYEAATFQAIADRAGVTRPAVHQNFMNKPDLFREVIARTESMILNVGVRRALDADTLVGQLSAFVQAATVADAEARAPAAVKATREFITWAVEGATERGELHTAIETAPLVEMLVAVVRGMGLYAGFVGNREHLRVITDQFRQLLDGKLWELDR